jgi:hypothetical protein
VNPSLLIIADSAAVGFFRRGRKQERHLLIITMDAYGRSLTASFDVVFDPFYRPGDVCYNILRVDLASQQGRANPLVFHML